MPKYCRSTRPLKLRHTSSNPHWAVVLSALVFSSYALVQLHQLFFQSNGAGSPGWAISQPQTHWNFRLGNQPLPELRVLALELVNRDRQVNGLPPLVEDPLLSQVAQRHAEDMLARQFYDHVNPDGQDPSARFMAAGGQVGAGEKHHAAEGRDAGGTLLWPGEGIPKGVDV